MAAEKTKPTWDKVNEWEDELDALHAIIQKTELTLTTKWGAPVYTLGNKNVIGIGGFKHYFTIWFFNGVFLKDKKKLLVNAQEGVTKALRQWRFTAKEELDERLILAYIAEAIANEKAEKTVPKVKKKLAISPLLQNAMTKNVELKIAFEKFTAYKQNDFMEYLESAKQEKTKFIRLEKIIPMILSNIGLHDKYK